MDMATVIKKSRNIADIYGTKYQYEVMQIDKWPSELLTNDWFASLDFWFSKSFYRGRRDEISESFFTRAISVIKNLEKKHLLNVPAEELEKLLINAGVNNHVDRSMVIQSLTFINNIPDHNLAIYSTDLIKADKTEQIHFKLQSIFGIGPKLASLYLRDLCFVYKLSPKTNKQLACLFPVDTWVRQVAVKLQIPGCTKDKSVDEIVEPVVDFCIQNNISPLLFNAGAWFVGARSFDLLLEII